MTVESGAPVLTDLRRTCQAKMRLCVGNAKHQQRTYGHLSELVLHLLLFASGRVCGVSSVLQHPGCLVFSIGSNGEPSFEQAILNSTPCEVHTWDHTLNDEKIQAVRKVPGINLHLLGIGSEAAAAHDNFTSLSKMLAGVQQEYIDVLKMDVEGGEWQILEDWYKSGRGSLPVSQLIVEFHSDFAVNGVEGTVAPVFEMLALDGFRVFAVEPNYYCLGGACAATYVEYSFIKVSKHGRVYRHGNKTHSSSLKHQSDV